MYALNGEPFLKEWLMIDFINSNFALLTGIGLGMFTGIIGTLIFVTKKAMSNKRERKI